ncbi:hypothetical protein SAMN04488107_4136 [Geodermatophilus saharensis]|uniref:Uncharacterized protein n=1 Tax=Geodermatophilus saharensis TaxID=1137994 RepID=A0A239I2K6_9ACTN|nr:hypothetical protein [Geodermatophilus saharensis]SNS88086.1 hypothetical protein SAMN04488107_4136 [Geodermatophilus saharensis]
MSTVQTDKTPRERRGWRSGEPLPPLDGPEAVGPPLRWARRLTPLGIGRRAVRLQVSGGRLSITRTATWRGRRPVVDAPLAEFHSAAPSRGGRGLHLWHGDRLFRLTGVSTAPSSGTVDLGGGDDPISGLIALVLLPVLLVGALGDYTDKLASQRETVQATLRWLGPVLGPPPPGLQVRPPLPGGPLTAARWLLRSAVVGAVVAGFVWLLLR